jgi:hypothetical protein
MLPRTHPDLIFDHAAERRVAASVTLAGVVAVLIGGVSIAIGPHLRDVDLARAALGEASPAPVRVISAGPHVAGGCGEQVWPNIDQRCLVRTDAKTGAEPQTKTGATPAAARDDDDKKLSPLTITATPEYPAPPEAPAATRDVQSARAITARRDTVDVTDRSRLDADDVEDTPPPEQPRRFVRRHVVFPFHVHFGGFRF